MKNSYKEKRAIAYIGGVRMEVYYETRDKMVAIRRCYVQDTNIIGLLEGNGLYDEILDQIET